MTSHDPITAIADQLAAHAAQLTRLEASQAELTGQAAAIGRVVAEHAAALTRLAAASQAGPDTGGYCPGPAPAWWKLAAADRPEPVARLRAWVEQVYRPGYGHLADGLGPCWPAHDLCLYGLDIAAELWSVLYLQPARTPALVSAQAEYQARILPALAGQLRAETNRCGHPRGPVPAGGSAMTGGTLRQALSFAGRGWPVLPCLPGQKIPATAHGYRDATCDERQITGWFDRHPDWNLAIATGAPGPDVLDIDNHGPAGNGYAAFRRLKDAGLLDGAATYVRTPSRGLHAYFAGSDQRNGHLAGHHVDFRSAGGYVLTPPSRVGGHPYQVIGRPGGRAGLDWAAVTRLLQPEPRRQQSRSPQAAGRDLSGLARWVAAQPEGNRNAGLFWAANRALETDPAADLSELAAAARQAGLGEREITRTLDSARNRTPGYQPEAGDQA